MVFSPIKKPPRGWLWLIQFFSIAGVFACVVGGFLLCSWSTKISQIVKVAGRELTEPKAKNQRLILIFRCRAIPAMTAISRFPRAHL
jgi:hypothetical protein